MVRGPRDHVARRFDVEIVVAFDDHAVVIETHIRPRRREEPEAVFGRQRAACHLHQRVNRLADIMSGDQRNIMRDNVRLFDIQLGIGDGQDQIGPERGLELCRGEVGRLLQGLDLVEGHGIAVVAVERAPGIEWGVFVEPLVARQFTRLDLGTAQAVGSHRIALLVCIGEGVRVLVVGRVFHGAIFFGHGQHGPPVEILLGAQVDFTADDRISVRLFQRQFGLKRFAVGLGQVIAEILGKFDIGVGFRLRMEGSRSFSDQRVDVVFLETLGQQGTLFIL